MEGKSEKEILDAEENFREYLLVIQEMADRVENEQNPQNIEDS